MSILIRGGTLLTMTKAGSFQADILIKNGHISRIAPDIPCEDNDCIHASGCVITPGWIDLHVRCAGDTMEHLKKDAIRTGVTSGLIWLDDAQLCHTIGSIKRRFRVIDPRAWTNEVLAQVLNDVSDKGETPVACVHDADSCHRLLDAACKAGVRVLLDLQEICEEWIPTIAEAGCPVLIGVKRGRQGGSWSAAAALHSLGVPVALSCHYPAAALKHLRVCAALCYRDGVPRAEALRMITTIPAGILGEDGIGCIAEGKRADLCIFDGDPLLLATSHLLTICGGRVIRHT